MNNGNQLNEKESLALIAQMINKAKESCHHTGVSTIMWGIVITVCSLVRVAEIHFNYWLPFDIYYTTFIAVLPQIYFSIREKRERRVKTWEDSFIDYTWLGFGISIFLLIIITNIIGHNMQPVIKKYELLTASPSPFRFYEYVAPLFLMLYGLPTFITGAGTKFRPMLLGGVFCWVASIITIYTPGKIDLLLTALAAMLAWLIPGIILEREYRKARKKLEQKNV
ncbi:MAG: hypothetical protein IPM85_13670 [Chitinophagaceae bacterium]|nr:hypothetical protein [Chitinophagaceae bacterium]